MNLIYEKWAEHLPCFIVSKDVDLCLISLQFNNITLGSKCPSPINPVDSVQYVTNGVV